MIKVHYSGSAGNLYQVENMLIDPGVSIKKIKEALGFKLSCISGCFCGHGHRDHCLAAKDLMKCGVDVYCSKDTAQSAGLSGHRLHIIEAKKQFTIEKYKIKPFDLVHDVSNLGVVISFDGLKVMYAVDTNYIPYRFTGLTHIILGVSYDAKKLERNTYNFELNLEVAKRILKSHLSIQTAVKCFQANDMSSVEEIHLVHLSDKNSDAEGFKTAVEKVTGRPVFVH